MTEGGGIFVSYRRDDSRDIAGRLADHLIDRFGKKLVFIDAEAVQPGVDFAESIILAVRSCQVLVAVIGPGWLTAADERGRRLDDPSDWVRVEVETTLARGVPLIPVLVRDAVMPATADLPDGLAGLAHRQALAVRYESFRHDAARLVSAVERALDPGDPGSEGWRSPSAGDSADDQAGTWTSAQASRAHAAHLFEKAARIASTVSDQHVKAITLCEIAAVVAQSDPGRAVLLLDDAEHAADAVRFEAFKKQALSQVAITAATVDPARTHRMLDIFAGTYLMIPVTCSIAATRVPIDHDSRLSLLEQCAREATALPDRELKAKGLYTVATAMARFDLERAESLANAIPGRLMKAQALSDIAAVAAADDPGFADRVATAITDGHWKAAALCGGATAVADADPARAIWMLGDAECAARSILTPSSRAKALSLVAFAVASVDRDRAARIVADAERAARLVVYEDSKTVVLTVLATALAAIDPGRAESVARSVGKFSRPAVLCEVAAVVACSDPSRAEQIAGTITAESKRALALVRIGGALAAALGRRADGLRPARNFSTRSIVSNCPLCSSLCHIDAVPAE